MPVDRPNSDWAGNQAALASAGWREVVQSTVTPGASGEAAYTVQDASTNRVVVFHLETNDDDIRVTQDGAAVATDFPVKSGQYVVFEAYKDETISFFNKGASQATVWVMEIL